MSGVRRQERGIVAGAVRLQASWKFALGPSGPLSRHVAVWSASPGLSCSSCMCVSKT